MDNPSTEAAAASRGDNLSPGQMSERTGVSIDTLRYYEREGLIQPVARASSGHRRYSGDDVLWVEVLRCLRDTGMTIDQLRHYADLGEQGNHTEPERVRILTEHRALVESQISERKKALELIDHKLTFYDHPVLPQTGTRETSTHTSTDTSTQEETP